MGNRAIIEHLDQNGRADTSIYLHWNGGRDSVEAFLEYAKLQGVDKTNDDYQMARLCQIIGNFMDGTYSLGIDTADRWSAMSEDNGVYVIDSNLNIVGRRNFDGYEQYEYHLEDFLKGLDSVQPGHMQLGEDFIEAYLENKNHPANIRDVELGDKVAIHNSLRGRWETFTIIGFGDKGTVGNGHDLEGLPFFNMTENYVETDSPFSISKWTDAEALAEHKGNSNCYIKKGQEFVIVKKAEKSAHIPDNQELSVEEINAYLEEFGFENWSEQPNKDVDEVVISGCDFVLGAEGINSFNTKEKLFEAINDAKTDFEASTWAEDKCGELCLSKDNPMDEGEIEQIYDEEKTIRTRLDNAVTNFDEKFDKCMAEFHANDRQDPKKVAREAIDVTKGASGKQTSRDAEER